MNVIVAGLIGQYPIGGVTWDYVQYALGLGELGHDVTYLEDSEQWPYNPSDWAIGRDARFNAEYLERTLARFGLADRWAYRFPGGVLPTGETIAERWYGLSDARRKSAVERADVLINVSSGIGDPTRYRTVPRLVYVDTDPVFTQIRAVQDEQFRAHLDAHDMHFTYGECLSDAVPVTGHNWRAMRKPIAIRHWRTSAARGAAFTTVMNWTSYENVAWNGRRYGQKDEEFARFIDLPSRVRPTVLEVAVASKAPDRPAPAWVRRPPSDLLRRNGWRLVEPMEICGDAGGYRRYIESSRGEWTVAKNAYVLGRSGWFSGRTACYLAAGRPVVVQDTGFGGVIPTGQGVVTFRDVDEAVEGIRQVEADWPRHSKAARAIAEEYFDARKMVGRLIDRDAAATAHAAVPAVAAGARPV